MKKSFLIIGILFISMTINAQKKIKGNGKMTSITRTTSDYKSIKCAGSFDYILVSGTEGTIKIEGEENLLEYIITEVRDGNLFIKTENRINLRPSTNKNIKITIPFVDIETVSLAGSGDLWNTDKIKAKSMKVSLAGSGDITLNIEATSMEVDLAGSGDITLKGNTNSLEASIAGSGKINGFDLMSNFTDVSISGSGDAYIVSNESLMARVTGSGDIKYKGNPTTEDTKVTGSGRISN